MSKKVSSRKTVRRAVFGFGGVVGRAISFRHKKLGAKLGT